MTTLQLAPDPARFEAFDSLYAVLRRREGRTLLDPASLRALPEPPPGTSRARAREWRSRAWCASFIERRLAARAAPRVLDLGCGPGWLAARLARNGREVVGLDVSRTELTAGAVAFAELERLRLVQGDVFDAGLELGRFDAVLLVAALQYFGDLPRLVARLRALLQPEGEVLLLETPIYRRREVDSARLRTRRHYESLGLPQLVAHYHHHVEDDLSALGARFLYHPSTLASRLQRHLLRRALSPHAVLSLPAEAC